MWYSRFRGRIRSKVAAWRGSGSGWRHAFLTGWGCILCILAACLAVSAMAVAFNVWRDEPVPAGGAVFWLLASAPFLWCNEAGRKVGQRVFLWAGAAAGSALLIYATRFSAVGDVPVAEQATFTTLLRAGVIWGFQAMAAPLLFAADAYLAAARSLKPPTAPSARPSS